MLSAYVDGELGGAEAERLRRHLDSCSECRKYLALLQTLHADLREDLPDPPETLAPGILRKLRAEKGRKKWYHGSYGRWTAIAAVLCLAVFGLVRLTGSGGATKAETARGYSLTAPAAGASSAVDAASGGAAGGALSAGSAEEERPGGAEGRSMATADTADTGAVTGTEPDKEALLTEEMLPIPMPAEAGSSDGFFNAAEAPAETEPGSVYQAASLRGYDLGRAALDGGEWYAVCICYALPERTSRADWLPLTPGEGELGRWSVTRETGEALMAEECFDEIYFGDLQAGEVLVLLIAGEEE